MTMYVAVRCYTDQIDEFLSYEGRLWLDQLGGMPIGVGYDVEALKTFCLDNVNSGLFKSTDAIIQKWIASGSGWYELKGFAGVHLIRDGFKQINFAIYPIEFVAAQPITNEVQS